MKFIFFAVFAVCACSVNGHYRFINSLRILDDSLVENDDSEIDDEELAQKVEENLKRNIQKVENILNRNAEEIDSEDDEHSSASKESSGLEDKFMNYWPQIVIIKPMLKRDKTFDLGKLLYGGKKKKRVTIPTVKPSTTQTTTKKQETDVDDKESQNTEVLGSESKCTTPSGGSGECVSIYDCKALLDLVNKKAHTSQDLDLLKRSQCGFKGTAPAVCCPKDEPPPEPEGNCFTPDGKVGQCISLYSCSHIANMLKPPVPSETITYVQKSKCNGPEQYSVCCGPPPDRNNEMMVIQTGNCQAHMSAYPPDPKTQCCGVDSRVGNKIVGGNATTVDQYPWLVMIEYVQGTTTKLLCGGVLVSGKYVLTAGHCVAGQVLSIGTPKRVRLGEYDIAHEGPDCAQVEAGGEDCTDGVTRILIDKVIPHPQYNPVSPLKRNDIALLRLKDVAPFTDFIRPICLPTKDLTVPPNTPNNFVLYAAGWGAVSDRKSYSNVKLHVELPFVTQEKCQPVYSFPGRSVSLWKAQLCAGGVTGKDSCKGDSGGPLMYEDGRTYEVVGIVSFGPVPCGMDGVPGVYSKVWEYMDWIRSTIVP